MNVTKQRSNYSKSHEEFQPFITKESFYKKIRLIDENNQYHASFYTPDAKKQAENAGLDLVCFSKGNRQKKELPLCKIIDYGKWKYSQAKKAKEQNQHQKHVTKEVQFSLNISDHDVCHKLKKVEGFLAHSMDVKLVMRLFGPDRRHFDRAEEKMEQIIKACADFGKVHDTKKTKSMIIIRMIPV